MLKKAVYSLLVLVMAASFGSVAFGAASTVVAPVFSDLATTDAGFELSLLGALGVFGGDSGVGGTVRPADSVTRAEFCKVVVTAMGKASIATGLAGLTPTFTDGASIPAWAWGFVNAASMMGIINGYADGSFKASNPVTYREAITMLVRAVPGHVAQVPAATWPYNYIWYGLDNGFVGTSDLSFPALPCPRGDMAIMTYATMQVNPLNTLGVEQLNTSVLPDDGVKVRRFDGTLADYANNASTQTVTISGFSAFTLAPTAYLFGAASLEGLKSIPVTLIYGTGLLKEKVVFVGASEGESLVVSGKIKGGDTTRDYIPAGDTDYVYLRLTDGTLIPFDTQVNHIVPATAVHPTVTLNGGTAANEHSLASGDRVQITKDADGFATHVLALRDWAFVASSSSSAGNLRAWVTKVTPAATATLNTIVDCAYLDNSNVNPDLWSNVVVQLLVPTTAKVTVNGATANRNDLAKWDVVYIGYKGPSPAPATGVYFVDAVRKTVSGTIKDTRKEYVGYPYPTFYSTIDTKEYMYLLASPPAKDNVITYGLDKGDVCYAPISYTQATFFWLINSYVDRTDPLPGDDVNVNVSGTDMIFKGDGDDFSLGIGYVNYVVLDAGRKVDEIYTADATGDFTGAFDVLSIDGANGVIVYDSNLAEGPTNVTPAVLNAPDMVIYLGGTTYTSGVGYSDDYPGIDSWLGVGGLLITDHIYISADFACNDGDGYGSGRVIIVRNRSFVPAP